MWGFSLLAAGLGSAFYAASTCASEPFSATERVAVYSVLLLCLYSAFQLIPLPVSFLRLLDPTRAEVADALSGIASPLRFSPVSVDPGKTCLYVSWVVGQALTFLLIREATRRTGGSWAVAIPLLVLGGIEAAVGIQQYIAGAKAVIGTNDNKDHLAGFLEMIFPFAVVYGFVILRSGKHGRSRGLQDALKGILLAALAAAMLAAIMFTLSKMGFASTLGSLFVMGVIAVGAKRSGPGRWATVAGVAALLLAVFVFLPPDALVSAYGSVPTDQTGEGRLPIWKDTLHLIAAYPVFGSGLGTYFPVFMRYETYGVDLTWLSAHNDYLEFFSELGVVGFLLLAGFVCAALGCTVRAAWSATSRETRLLGLACTGGLAAILIHSAADFNMHIPANAVVLTWIAGIAVALPLASTKPPRKTRVPQLVRAFMLVLGCVAALYGTGWLLYLHRFQGDLNAERMFCRFGICDSYQAAYTLQRQYGGAAMVPPDQLLAFLQRDPAGPYRWADLGESLQKAGRMEKARYCFERAVALSPEIPTMLNRAARFYFSQGDKARGFELTRRILARSPDWLDFDDYGQGVKLEEILRDGLPADRRVWRFALHLKIQQNKFTDAAAVWDALLSRHYADDKLANEYADFLIGKKQPEAAEQAWARYACKRDKAYPESNRVFNGDFESDPAESQFDWRIEVTPGAAIDFDREFHYSGARSLRIRFDGTQNVSRIGVSQTVFLKPGRYRFEAYVRARDISTDEGVAFRVANEEAANRFSFTTKPLLGSTDWTLLEHPFTVPPSGAGLVNVALVRTPSLRFDNLIRGTLWIDRVTITPENKND